MIIFSKNTTIITEIRTKLKTKIKFIDFNITKVFISIKIIRDRSNKDITFLQ